VLGTADYLHLNTVKLMTFTKSNKVEIYTQLHAVMMRHGHVLLQV